MSRVLIGAAPSCDVALAAYDGLDAGLFGFFVEAHGAEHYAVVCDSYGIHAKLFGARHEFVYAAGAIEQGVFRMIMQMYERHDDL